MLAMPDRRIEVLRHFPTLLDRWRGTDAQLRELTTGHRTLRLFLQSPSRNGFLLIACIDPHRIEAPIAWARSNIRILPDEADGFVVLDTDAGVRIQTGHVEVKEFD